MSITHPTARKPRQHTSRDDRRRGRKKPLVTIKQHELVSLLDVCTPQRVGHAGTLAAERLRAAMVLLDRTGIRSMELLDLNESDLSLDDGTIVIRCGKGGKRRVVAMDAWGWRELEDWIAVRNEHIRPGYLLPTIMGPTAGERWADSDLRRQLRDAAQRAGLKHTAHPHSWRHGWATRARRDGMGLDVIQTQLGHADLSVTEIYLDDIDPIEKLRAILDRPAPMIEVPHHRRR